MVDKTDDVWLVIEANRAFFPKEPMAAARKADKEALEALGHTVIMTPEGLTKYGAIESEPEGAAVAKFALQELAQHPRDRVRVLLNHPNFGTEQSSLLATGPLMDAGYPVLVMAAPDKAGELDPEHRLDAFCGKFSIMDVYTQNGFKMGEDWFAFTPHTVRAGTPRWVNGINAFEAVLSGQKSFSDYFKPIPFEPTPEKPGPNVLRGMRILAIGASTTPFDTTDIDVVTLRRHGINVRAHDLSELFWKMDHVDHKGPEYEAAQRALEACACWTREFVPLYARDQLVRLEVAINDMVRPHAELMKQIGGDLAITVRCWTEMQYQRGISPCMIMGRLNAKYATACEVDNGNALLMQFMRRYTGNVSACEDWNNNFGETVETDNKGYMMHCGPHNKEGFARADFEPYVGDHHILKHAAEIGPRSGFGCLQARHKPGDMVYGSASTVDGKVVFYLGKGEVTDDKVPDEFFGFSGVWNIPEAQTVYQNIGYLGGRHHFSISMVEKGKADEVLDRMIADLTQHPGFQVVDMRKASEYTTHIN